MNISPLQNLKMALTAVWTHRFRSLLTILGIVIGITTVVTVASLLTGLRKGVVTFFDELGPDNVFIYKTSGDPHGRGSEKERKRRAILPEYAEAIRRSASSVEDVGITLFIPNVVNGNPLTARVPGFESDSLSVIGTTPNSTSLSPRDFRAGRYFTPEEDARVAHVAVLGNDLADTLYPDGHALGRTFTCDGAEYTVIGVFAKAKGGFFGQNDDDTQIVIPLRTAESRYPQVDRFMIVAKGKPGMRKQAYDEVEQIIRRVRKTPRNQPDDFSISTPDQIIEQFDKITGLI
ncbi:MAG: ABC transporter permease, partial [Acidobacteriota bacterium]|nr:ABC transporter permease [Acidobacteriota bacterium]